MPFSILNTFIVIFVLVLVFIILNTALAGIMFPIFNIIGTTVTNTTAINATSYTAESDKLGTFFNLVLIIILAIPFIYLFIRVFKKEPQPVYYPQYGGEGHVSL